MNEDTYGGDLYNPMSQNRYTYFMNDPVNYIDPTGHITVIPGDGYIDDGDWNPGTIYNYQGGGYSKYIDEYVSIYEVGTYQPYTVSLYDKDILIQSKCKI